MDSVYYNGYPKEPIGGNNPYQMCSECGVSEPEINGRLGGHSENCAWRKQQELRNKLCTHQREFVGEIGRDKIEAYWCPICGAFEYDGKISMPNHGAS